MKFTIPNTYRFAKLLAKSDYKIPTPILDNGYIVITDGIGLAALRASYRASDADNAPTTVLPLDLDSGEYDLGEGYISDAKQNRFSVETGRGPDWQNVIPQNMPVDINIDAELLHRIAKILCTPQEKSKKLRVRLSFDPCAKSPAPVRITALDAVEKDHFGVIMQLVIPDLIA